MKIRNGFISNSSSASFCIPSTCLTEEQKEVILSIDSYRKLKQELNKTFSSNIFKNPIRYKIRYKRNNNFHKIYKEMVKKRKFDNWEISEDLNKDIISGSTSMDNGFLEEFLSKIGVDLTCMEFRDDCETRLATNPKAIKILKQSYRRWYNSLTARDKKVYKMSFGESIPQKSEYEG